MNSVQDILAALRSGSITRQQADMYMSQLRNKSKDPAGDWQSYSQGLQDITVQNAMVQGQNRMPLNVSGLPNSQAIPLDFGMPKGAIDFTGFQGNPAQGLDPSKSGIDLSFMKQQGNPSLQTPIQMSSHEKSMRDKGYSEEEIQYRLKNYNEDGSVKGTESTSPYINDATKNASNTGFPYIYPGGTDLNTRANIFGQFAGLNSGTKGKGAGMVLSGLSLGLGLAGDIASGIGYSKVNQETNTYLRKKQFGVDDNQYVANSQTKDNNYTGGNSFREGGLFRFEEGGEMPSIQDIVLQAVQHGVKPDQIMQTLIQLGVAQEQAQQIIQSISQGDDQQEGEQQESDQDFGGTDIPTEEKLSGRTMSGLSKDSLTKPNAEVEKKEAIKFPDGTVEQVDGPSHEQGGVKVKLPSETRVLSDDSTITKAEAKKLQKEYGIEVSDKDTFAKVLTKYNQKIGLTKLQKDQEEVFKILERQQKKKDVDEGTMRVNTEYLANKIKSIEDEKAPKEADKQRFFEVLYAFQEKDKGESKTDGNKMRAGGEIPQYPDGGKFEEFNKLSTSNPTDKNAVLKQFSDAYKKGEIDAGQYTTLFNNIGGNGVSQVQPTSSVSQEAWGGLKGQELEDVKRKWNSNEDAYKKFLITKTGIESNTALQDKLYQQYQKDIASKDIYTSGDKGLVRYSKELQQQPKEAVIKELLAQEERNARLAAFDKTGALKRPDQSPAKGELINKTALDIINQNKEGLGDIKEGFGRGHIGQAAYIAYNNIMGRDYKNFKAKPIGQNDEVLGNISGVDKISTDTTLNQFLNYNPEPTMVDKPKAEQSAQAPAKEGPITDNINVDMAQKLPRNFYHPAQIQLPPSPLNATYMGNIDTQYLDPTRVGIESNIQALSDQNKMVAGQLDSLPPSQRAAALSSLLASTQQGYNQAIMGANMANANSQQQVEQFNIGQFDRNQQNNFNIKQNYTNKMEQGQAILEENLRNYFNFNQKVALHNKAIDDQRNLLASVYDFTPNYWGNQINFDPQDNYQLTPQKNDIFGALSRLNSTEK